MATQSPAQAESIRIESDRPHWHVASRIAFRFAFLYLGLYCLTTQVLTGLVPIPEDVPALAEVTPIRQIVSWTAAHVFHVSTPLIYTGSGSGDKTFDWVFAFCVLFIAVAATAVWSVQDRKRQNYIALHKWFHLFLRFSVGSTMLEYGMIKVVPLQMPFPFLTKLVEPFGNFSPMGVLWFSIGASQGYERFVGCAEMLGGILLFFPRTTTFGAFVCLADATEVFMLNMTYDVPVKLFSFHLILMSLILLAPELPRIARFFFSNRPIGPSRHPQLFRTPPANRVALIVQVVFGLVLIAMNGYGARTNWHVFGGGAPKSPLYGIWNVDQLSRDGELRPALLTDKDRWRRVIFERPDRMTFQHMDDTFVNYGATIDTKEGYISLTKGSDKNWKGRLKFQRSNQDQLVLDGEMDGHRFQVQLQLWDRNKLLLVNRGFHWIQEYPFNR
jgi:uncharacterized membrane protein YphA (DoxX/SURF4 family)